VQCSADLDNAEISLHLDLDFSRGSGQFFWMSNESLFTELTQTNGIYFKVVCIADYPTSNLSAVHPTHMHTYRQKSLRTAQNKSYTNSVHLKK